VEKREIKFRAWVTTDKPQMLQGVGIYTQKEIDKDGGSYTITGLGIYVNPTHKKVEVMQFTGRKDKNEKEIFEGDILIHHGGNLPREKWSRSKVVFAEGAFLCDGGSTQLWDIEGDVEVIGNIHENPELIKE